MLEDIMNPIILVKYIQVATLLCTLFVTIQKVEKCIIYITTMLWKVIYFSKISGQQMVSFIEYGMMAMFDLAMLCYSGEIIKGEVSF